MVIFKSYLFPQNKHSESFTSVHVFVCLLMSERLIFVCFCSSDRLLVQVVLLLYGT